MEKDKNESEESDWSRSVFLFSVLAAVFGALYLANDTFIMHQVILSEDSFTAVSAYLILGGWIGTICTFVYNAFLGNWLDTDYMGFNFGTSKMQILALASGAIAAGSTTFCLMGNQSLDPSLVIALSNLSILYIVLYDGIRGTVSLKQLWFSTFLVIIGSILASTMRFAGSLEITFLGITLLLVGRCGTDAVERIVRQQGVRESDAVIFNFWRFLWLTISGTILVSTIALFRGTFSELKELLMIIWRPALPWVLLTMFFVFFFGTLLQKAMKIGAVSRVSMVVNLQIVLGIPITLAVDWWYPGVFGEIPTDLATWIVRLTGSILIVAGIMRLRGIKKSS